MGKAFSLRAGRVAVIGVVALSLLATACGRSGSDNASSSTIAGSAASAKCKDAKLEATENGVSAATITIQVMADVGSPLAPGLFQGNVDAVKAFAQWANDNGGIGCRQVKVLEWDSKMDPTEAKNGLINGCQNALALIGDNALFNPDTATLSNCADKAGQPVGLPNFVGLANDANESCQPTTGNVQSISELCTGTLTGVRDLQTQGGIYRWFAKNLAPDNEFFLVPGDLPTTVQSATYIMAAQKAAGINVVGSIKVSSRAEQTVYTQYFQAAKSSGANTIFNGSNSGVMLKAQKEAKAQGVLGDYKWAGSLSIYDKTYTAGDPSVTNGTYAGLSQLPWDEADKSPGLAAYLKYVGGVEKADALGANGFMAGIAFKETVDAIVAAKGPNAITRAAVIEGLKTEKSDFMGWVGQPKGGKDILPCYMIVQIQDGKWKRVYPTAVGQLDCSADNRIIVKLDTGAEAAKIP
jgi:ABC-type branched-subunit amino acid transport system substrate-binding protein